MHPLNPKNFGATGIGVQFYDGSDVVSGHIVRQIGTNRFVVSDDTTTKTVKLAPTTDIASDLASNPTYFTFSVEPPVSGASGGTFTAHYKVQDDATVVSSNGTHWNVGDQLTLSGGTGSAGVLEVGSLATGHIATVSVATPGNYTALPSNPVTGVRAAGSGASFTVHYGVDSATVAAAGTGYAMNDTITLASTGSAVITVDTVGGGGQVLTFHVSAAGSGVTSLSSNPRTQSATSGIGSSATFNVKYKVLSVTSSGGTGYNVADTLIFGGMTATTTATAHISVATSHAATTVVVDTPGVGITVAASSVTTSTTTGTFNLQYQLLSVASSGGSGYVVGDQLVFSGMVSTTHPTAHISTATSGAATAVTVDTSGDEITTAATSIGVGGADEHVARIWEDRVYTTDGNTYHWTLDTSVNGSAVIHTVGF